MENLASEQKFYTYEDYLKINDGNRYEIIHGVLYLKDEWGDMRTNTSKIEKVKMLAAPSVLHQEIVLEIGAQLKEKLKGKKCKTFVSPIDVILNEEKDYRFSFSVGFDGLRFRRLRPARNTNTNSGFRFGRFGRPDIYMENGSRGIYKRYAGYLLQRVC